MTIPRHVAIILDGNGRWAKAKGMPRTYGHIKGCENLEKNLRYCQGFRRKIFDSICFFHRELEAFKRRSGRSYEAVSELYEALYSDFKR